MPCPRRVRTRAFTIIELLVVITILALLMSIAAFGYRKFIESGNRAATVTTLETTKGIIEQYHSTIGDYPKSRLSDYNVKTSNLTNEGSEALVVALYLKTYDGARIDDKFLANVDEDRIEGTNPLSINEPILRELVDAWGNPVVYIQYSDFEREQEYSFKDASTEEWVNVTVKAEKNPQTGNYYARDSFQLLSVGQDGIYGTADDITSYR